MADGEAKGRAPRRDDSLLWLAIGLVLLVAALAGVLMLNRGA